MLQSVERLQGWVLLYKAVQNKSQMLSNLFNLTEFLLAALHQTSSKGWRQWMEHSSDLRLQEKPRLLLQSDLRCECWALLGFSQEALSQPYASLRDASAQHKHCLGSGKASRTCKLCHWHQWLHWPVPPPRAHSWNPDVLPSLPSRAGHPKLFGVSKPATPHQHWDKLRETTAGDREDSEEIQNPKITRCTELCVSWTLKNFSKIP